MVDVAGNQDGGIVLGRHLQNEIAWVTIDNLRIEKFHDAGITYPENLELDENHDLAIVNNTDRGRRVDRNKAGDLGVERRRQQRLARRPGRPGREGNVIEGANHFGIDGYSFESLFRGNTIRDIGRIEELSASGLGCGVTGTNCTENGDGFRLRLSTSRNAHDNEISATFSKTSA